MSDTNTNNIVSKEGEVVKKTSQKDNLSRLLAKAKTLPTDPGCYLMKNKYGEIIYIGKAKNLKSRVQSYFNKSAKSPKTQILIRHIIDFDFILTKNESESFILENNLIKEHLPKYNIRLKDDKSYPYVTINYNEDFPRLEYTRRPQKKKLVDILGPFPVGSNISLILKSLTKSLQLRECSLSEYNSRKEPCLLYQMKQCTAPCVGKISKEKYSEDLKRAVSFFKSKNERLKTLEHLTSEMMNEASLENFERAAFLRDNIELLDQLQNDLYKQNVELNDNSSIDIIAFFESEKFVDMSLYLIRDGNLLGQKNFHFNRDDFEDFSFEDRKRLIAQYYTDLKDSPPEKVLCDFESNEMNDLKSLLIDVTSSKIKLIKRSKKYESIYESALSHAQECQRVRVLNKDSVYVGLDKLKELLKLKDRPTVLECYDIAIWQGKSPTAAQIVSINGVLEKKLYRHFHLKERVEGNNDFAMMEEVLDRRLEKGHLPDVFVIDGGLGQVNAVKKSLAKKKIDVPVVGIAKAKSYKSKDKTQERLIIPGRLNPYLIYRCPPLMRIVLGMRDEAHRFSRRLHHKQENKRVFNTWIDKIPSISKTDKKEILQFTNQTQEELSELSYSQLEKMYPIKESVLKKLFNFLKG